MPNNDDKGNRIKGLHPKLLIVDEIPEYRSEDLQIDWPEPYVPAFPLTDAERRLQALNAVPANFIDYTHGRISLVPLIPDENPDKK